MNRLGACLPISLGSASASLHALEAASTHPNLLFVLVDPMRGQALGFLNEDPVLTPRLERTRDPWLAPDPAPAPPKE